MKWFAAFCTIGAVYVSACSNDDFRIIDSIYDETPCTLAGGMCVLADDCPELSEQRGLCPEQRSRGVECCYGMSVKETRCTKHGGMCYPGNSYCGGFVRYTKATDCPRGSTCCILIYK